MQCNTLTYLHLMRCILKHLAEGILGVPYYSINAVFVTLDDGGSL